MDLLVHGIAFQRFFDFPETASGHVSRYTANRERLDRSEDRILAVFLFLLLPFFSRLLQYSEISRKRACAYGIPYEGYAIDAGRWERIGMIEKPDGIGYWKAINLRYRDCDRGSQGRGNAIYLFFLLIFNPICTKLFELCCFDR